MSEDKAYYYFPSYNHRQVVFGKENYKRHIPKHPFISGEAGLVNIEKTLIHPSIITRHTQRNKNRKPIRKCQTYYRIIKERKINKNKLVLDYWKVVIIFNKLNKRWEIATTFLEEYSPEYAMINNRIESILIDNR